MEKKLKEEKFKGKYLILLDKSDLESFGVGHNYYQTRILDIVSKLCAIDIDKPQMSYAAQHTFGIGLFGSNAAKYENEKIEGQITETKQDSDDVNNEEESPQYSGWANHSRLHSHTRAKKLNSCANGFGSGIFGSNKNKDSAVGGFGGFGGFDGFGGFGNSQSSNYNGQTKEKTSFSCDEFGSNQSLFNFGAYAFDANGDNNSEDHENDDGNSTFTFDNVDFSSFLVSSNINTDDAAPKMGNLL